MNHIKNFFSKKGSISLISGVISLLVGVSILVIPVYANNEVPFELPEVVGDQIPSLDDKVKEDKQENHKNKTVHDRFEKEHQKHKKDIEESLPQLPESPVSELPEPSSQVVDTNKEKTETKDKESSFMKGANPTTIQPKEAQQSLLSQKQTAQIEKNTNTDSTSEGEAPVVRTRSGTLPKTATNAPNGVVAGGFILLGGALIHRYYRVKNDA